MHSRPAAPAFVSGSLLLILAACANDGPELEASVEIPATCAAPDSPLTEQVLGDGEPQWDTTVATEQDNGTQILQATFRIDEDDAVTGYQRLTLSAQESNGRVLAAGRLTALDACGEPITFRFDHAAASLLSGDDWSLSGSCTSPASRLPYSQQNERLSQTCPLPLGETTEQPVWVEGRIRGTDEIRTPRALLTVGESGFRLAPELGL